MAKASLQAQTPQTGKVVVMPGIFEETLNLLLEAHDYFNYFAAEEQRFVHPSQRFAFSNEMSRVTMRLTSIMAWLMVRKAVYAGKITESEAVEKYKLDARDICLHKNDGIHHMLPEYMEHLLDRSHELYSRVSRLDEMLAVQPQAIH